MLADDLTNAAGAGDLQERPGSNHITNMIEILLMIEAYGRLRDRLLGSNSSREPWLRGSIYRVLSM